MWSRMFIFDGIITILVQNQLDQPSSSLISWKPYW